MTDVQMIPSARAMEKARTIWPGLTIQSLAVTLDAAVMEKEQQRVKLFSLIKDYHHDYCEHSGNPCECGWCKLKEEVGL